MRRSPRVEARQDADRLPHRPDTAWHSAYDIANGELSLTKTSSTTPSPPQQGHPRCPVQATSDISPRCPVSLQTIPAAMLRRQSAKVPPPPRASVDDISGIEGVDTCA